MRIGRIRFILKNKKKVKSIALLFTFYLLLIFLACSSFVASSSVYKDLATIVELAFKPVCSVVKV